MFNRSRRRARFRSGKVNTVPPPPTDKLLTEGGDRLVQEDASPILV